MPHTSAGVALGFSLLPGPPQERGGGIPQESGLRERKAVIVPQAPLRSRQRGDRSCLSPPPVGNPQSPPPAVHRHPVLPSRVPGRPPKTKVPSSPGVLPPASCLSPPRPRAEEGQVERLRGRRAAGGGSRQEGQRPVRPGSPSFLPFLNSLVVLLFILFSKIYF